MRSSSCPRASWVVDDAASVRPTINKSRLTMDTIPSLGTAPVDATPRVRDETETKTKASELRQDRETERDPPGRRRTRGADQEERHFRRAFDNRSFGIEEGQVCKKDRDHAGEDSCGCAAANTYRNYLWLFIPVR